tara:strand:+ start:557 stop:895 length:339 start_codon:yes stop_codon:yes gene_type:complete
MTIKRFELQDKDGVVLGELVGDYTDHEGLVRTMYDGAEVAFVVDATPPDAAFKRDAESMRQQRNALLTASDWTQVLDSPVDKVAWAAYRQELRDITSQDGFPNAVAWPAQPV